MGRKGLPGLPKEEPGRSTGLCERVGNLGSWGVAVRRRALGSPGGGLGALLAESLSSVREAPDRTKSASPQRWSSPLPPRLVQPSWGSWSRGSWAQPWPKLSALAVPGGRDARPFGRAVSGAFALPGPRGHILPPRGSSRVCLPAVPTLLEALTQCV